ncbi:MAG: SDR family oxidoreductase [Planctomycetota bacterium]
MTPVSKSRSDGPLDGRVAVITGASAGIGEAIARSLHASGASVVLNARRADRLEAIAAELSEGAAIAPGDAADGAIIGEMLQTALKRFGKPADLVVVNAGRGLAGSVTTSDPEQWEEMVRVNLLGAARLMRAAADTMIGAGPGPAVGDGWLAHPRDIVVIGSNVGRHHSPFSSMYGSTKFAVNSLAEAQRRELAPKGIRVTLIEPGIVASEFQGVAGYDEQWWETFGTKFAPLLKPEDVARAVEFVVSQPAGVHVNDVMLRPTRQDYP